MKRLLIALFASVGLAMFAGCGGGDDDAEVTVTVCECGCGSNCICRADCNCTCCTTSTSTTTCNTSTSTTCNTSTSSSTTTADDSGSGNGGSNGGGSNNKPPLPPPPPPVLHTTVTVVNDASVSATVRIDGVDSPSTASIGGGGAQRDWTRTGTSGSTITFNPGYPGAEDQTMPIPGGASITVHITDSVGSPGTIEVSIN